MRIDSGNLTLEAKELNHLMELKVVELDLSYKGVYLDVDTGIKIALDSQDIEQLHSFLGDVLNKLG